MPTTITAALQSRPYPGRGLVAARSQGGSRCIVYFLTGRSPSSRQRRLAILEREDVAVQGLEPGQFDPLRHYVAAARRGSWVVVGNGSQVVPIAEQLAAGSDALAAWRQHGYEPDGPIFTPRIWVATTTGTPGYLLGYALRAGRGGEEADRVLWDVEDLRPGRGVLMSTYDGSAEVVSTARVPVDIETFAASAGTLVDEVFAALDPNLRVAAFALDPDAPGARIEART
ncbi:MAG: IMP cyclohydrolase [Solirubrobacteraceae bacterium]